MQLTLNQLATHLKQPLVPLYLLYGDEILLRQEARDAIRQAAVQAGYQQYQRFDVENNFAWQQLSYHCNSMSLFQEKSLIELHNPNSKFDAQAAKVLIAYSQNPAPDKLLIISCGKLTSAQQKSAWVQAIKQVGVVIPIYPIAAHELPRWITQRLQQIGLTADQASIQLLAELTEGNLLACQQAIEKLRLLYPPATHILPSHIGEVATHSARFSIFELCDYLLKADCRHVLTILISLRTQGAEPTLILWLLVKELRQLIIMLTQLQQGKSLQQVVASQWQQRQSFYKQALSRLDLTSTKRLLQFAHQIDCTIKGQASGDVWQQLTRLSLALAGRDPLPNICSG